MCLELRNVNACVCVCSLRCGRGTPPAVQPAQDGPAVLGLRAQTWPSVKFSRIQCGAAAHKARWAILHPAPSPRGAGKGRAGIEKQESGDLDMLQPMADKRPSQCLKGTHK